jgi:cell wall-associated NlpC family hydrolase
VDDAPQKLDPRINAFRPDLADASLRAFVTASSYVEPAMAQCVRGVVPVWKEPVEGAEHVSDVRYGEFLDVFERRADGFLWVQNRNDHYVGYIRGLQLLSERIASLSYRVKALHSFVYAEPDLKSRVCDRLTLGSYLSVAGQEGDYYALDEGGFVYAAHVAPSEEAIEPDTVFTAGRLLGVPYLWGGRTPLGIDCSGLVQLALTMAGYDEAPRDSDLQRAAYGRPLSAHWRDLAWQRGDIVFFKGHVGLMTSHDHLIHASGRAQKVVVEPLAEVVAMAGEILAIGRP